MTTLVIVGFPKSAESVVPDVSAIASRFQSVFLIHPQYHYVKSIDLPENVTVIPDHANDVFRFRIRNPPPGGFPTYQYKQIISPYTDRVEFMRATTETILFACIDLDIVSTTVSLAALVKTEKFIGREWLVVPSIPAIATTRPTVFPDFMIPHEGEVDWSGLNDDDQRAIDWLVMEGVCCVRSWLGAGYQVMKNTQPIPGFAATIGSRWISLVVSAFQIMPGEPDRPHQNALHESASLRKLITDASIYSLSFLLRRYPKVQTVFTKKMFTRVLAKETQREPGPLDFVLYNNPLLSPSSPTHDNLVVWNSPHLWDVAYDMLME